jgi:HK97 gp10 family phage protein
MSATVTIKIEGLDKFQAKLSRMSKAAASEKILDSLEAGARVIEAHAKNNAREKLNKNPTGFLTNSIGVKREGKSVLVGVFGVVYAKIHEFGGVIKARAAKLLVFRIGGKLIRTKSVHIPARPYLRPAVDENMPAINEAIGDAMAELLEKA